MAIKSFLMGLSRAAGAGGSAIRKTGVPMINTTGYLLASSILLSVNYEPWSKTLTITFRSGSVYEYYGVSATMFEGLRAADSPGRFHHEYINNNYSYKRIL